MSYRVRQADPHDLAAVIALERATPTAPHWPEPEYLRYLHGDDDRNTARRLFVAEREDPDQDPDPLAPGSAARLLGFAVGKVDRIGIACEGELESVAVAEDARRTGIGAALCRAVLEGCTELGAEVVQLEVRRASVAAIALYRQLGFQETGQRRRYYRDPPDDAVLMRWERLRR